MNLLRKQPEADLDDASGKTDTPGTPREQFRWPVMLLGAVLIPVNSLWIARAEAMDYSGFPTCASLFYNVIFSLLVLLLINVILRRALPRFALCRRELLVVYGMLATGSSLVGHDTMQMLVPSIPHMAYFNTDQNQVNLIVPHLPKWMTITIPSDSITKYEQGHSTLYRWDYIKVWILPIAVWTLFLSSVIAWMLSLNVILRKHWVEEERLTYPVVQIPMLITEGGGVNYIFKSKVFWIGFLLAAGLDLWNGLALFFPAIPPINVKATNISSYFTSRPWNATGWTMISFYPFVIGLSYFMPTNIAFSSWFFFFFRKAQQIISAAAGYEGTDAWYPFIREQAYGALIALSVATIWYGRGYLKKILKSAFAREGSKGYRWAMYGFIGGTVVMLGFMVAAGMKPWVAFIYVALYIMFCVALTRIRAELGPPAHEMGWIGTSDMMIMAFGTALLGPKSLAVLGLLHFQNRMHRGILMPQQAESLKAASQSGLRIRTMVFALAAAGVIGVLSAFWALMHLSYGRHYAASVHPGAPGSAFATEAYAKLTSWLSTPIQTNYIGIFAIAVGAAVAMLLAKFTVAFYGFPFHPAGFALGMSFGIDYIWLPVMVSWLVKVMILRYAGLKGYRAAMPFFVGLVLGEFAIGGMWSFIRGVLGVTTYTFFY